MRKHENLNRVMAFGNNFKNEVCLKSQMIRENSNNMFAKRPIVNSLTLIVFCLILCTSCEEKIEESRLTNTIKLDGWYSQTSKISLNGNYTLLSFSFRDKYKKLGVDECVHISALYIEEKDYKRIYPIKQKGHNFIVDIKDVDMLIIKSIHPGKAYEPYSQEITLEKVAFHK